MPKKKHRRFCELNTFANVVQPGYRYPVNDHPLKGQWGQKFFCIDNPLILEVGCGKGEYTVGLANVWPEMNFLGVDIKGNRMWIGAKQALENAMGNVGFLRIQAEILEYFFSPGEVSAIWVTFPDPQPNKPRERKRLTSQRFLNIYRKFLKPDGFIYLKTDNFPLYEYTLEVIKSNGHQLHFATDDLYGNPGDTDPVILGIRTYYESIFLEKGMNICFIKFSLDKDNL